LVRNAASTSSLIAGAGLTGGGALNSSTDVTFNIGAGTGILVSSDSIAFDTSVLGGYVTGSGTSQRISKWTVTGSVLGDSRISDDGTSISMAGDYHSGVQDGQLLIEGANVGTGQGGPVAFTGGNSTANPGSGGEFIAQAGAGTTSGGYVSIDAGDATVDGTGGAAQLTGGDGIGAGKTGGPVLIASGLGTGGATGADITLESSKDIWLKAAAGGHVYINNPAASFAAKQDMSLLTTAERTYTWPDTSGTLWVDNHSTGLTSVDDPLLTWTPVAGSGGGYKAFAGGGGFSFSISQSGATGLITATTATGSWFFDGGVGAAQILEVNGRIKATKFNHLAITNNTLGSQTLDIALNKTLTISNTLRFVGTDSTVHTFPSTSSSVARIDAAQDFTGLQTFKDGISLGETADTVGILGSVVGNAAGVKSIQLKPTVALTSGTDRWTHTMEDSAGNVRLSIASNGAVSLFSEGATNAGLVSVVGTADAAMTYGIFFSPTWGATAGAVIAGYSAAVTGAIFSPKDAASTTATTLLGSVTYNETVNTTRSHTNIIGSLIRGAGSWTGTTASTTTGLYGFYVQSTNTVKNQTITGIWGGYISDAQGTAATGTGTTTSSYGLEIAQQTRGATNNIGLMLDSGTAGYKCLALGSTSNWLAWETATTFSLNTTTVLLKCDTDVASGKKLTYNSSQQLLWGTGSPETVVTATVGSMFLRTDGGASTTLYIKESGTGNTGWIAK